MHVADNKALQTFAASRHTWKKELLDTTVMALVLYVFIRHVQINAFGQLWSSLWLIFVLINTISTQQYDTTEYIKNMSNGSTNANTIKLL